MAVVTAEKCFPLEWGWRKSVQGEVVVGWSHTRPRRVCNSDHCVAAGVGGLEAAMSKWRDNNRSVRFGEWVANE